MCCIYISWPNLGFGHFIPDLLFQVSLISENILTVILKESFIRILKNFEDNDLMLSDWSTYVTDKEYVMFKNLIFHGGSKFQEFDAKSIILRKKVKTRLKNFNLKARAYTSESFDNSNFCCKERNFNFGSKIQI